MAFVVNVNHDLSRFVEFAPNIFDDHCNGVNYRDFNLLRLESKTSATVICVKILKKKF